MSSPTDSDRGRWWAGRIAFVLHDDPAKNDSELLAELDATTSQLAATLEADHPTMRCCRTSSGNVEAAPPASRCARSAASFELSAPTVEAARALADQVVAAARETGPPRLDITMISYIEALRDDGLTNPATAALARVLEADRGALRDAQTAIGSKNELDAAANVRDLVEALLASDHGRVAHDLHHQLEEIPVDQVDWTSLARALRQT